MSAKALIARRLERSEQDYWEAIDKIADTLRSEYVLPYCKRTRRTFVAGMGAYFFVDAKGEIVQAPPYLDQALDERLMSGYAIGSLVNDVKSEEIRP